MHVRVCLVRMLFSNRACEQSEQAGRHPKLMQVADGLNQLQKFSHKAFFPISNIYRIFAQKF